LYVSTTDEHDQDGVIISDVYTDTVRRKKMVDKRARKFEKILEYVPAPKLEGPAKADVTLVGWGSTWGVIHEACERLNAEGISCNYLQIKVVYPLHVDAITQALKKAKKIIMVEMNHSGQFARHLRADTGITAHAHIRKYDGEPFEPKHVVNGVKEILNSKKELIEVLSTEPGWQTEHPTGTSGDWEGRKVTAGARAAVGVGGRQHTH
jgi:2-oxoglutarate ferredoxin oxidoreductase subunit alpha